MKWTLVAALAALILSGMLVASYAQNGTAGTQKVTFKLQNASFADVTKWLADHGINFVVEQGTVNKNRKLDINVRNVPLSEALTAISEGFGGTWSKRGSIYVFKPNAWPDVRVLDTGGMAYTVPKVPEVPGTDFKVQVLPPSAPKIYQWQSDGMGKGEYEKAVQEFVKEIVGLTEKAAKGDAYRKAVEKEAKAFAEKMRNSDFQWWTTTPMPPNPPSFDKFPEMKLMPKIDLKELDNLKDLKLKELDLKGLKDLKLKEFGDLKDLNKLDDLKFDLKKLPSIDGKGLIGSLTPAQLEKQAKQGYLTLEDLTPKQKEMIGASMMTGDWTVSFSIDGKNVTIKSK